ncbi:MAG: protein-glutamate O-methyltransferase CheR, partial [Gammaproteobacteria bacterium]
YLKDVLLPALSGPKMTTPRIWSAASSYGHEPYSISIVVEEYLEKNPGSMPGGLQILGTDISTKVLKQAEDAEYDILGLSRGLSEERKKKYFIKTSDGMEVRDKVRLRVSFQALNLLQSFSGLGKFDVIFCRNVLIYFSNKNKTHILDRMAECLYPGGHLFLGASEPIANYSKRFELVSWPRGVIYRLAG